MLLHRLALQLGRTVGELKRSISYRELLRWGRYGAVEPWGEWRADVRSALMAMETANGFRAVIDVLIGMFTKDHEPSKPRQLEDFMLFKPKSAEPERAATPDESDLKPEGALIAPETLHFLFAKARQTEMENRTVKPGA